jgi:hypothetical protein
MIHHGNADYKIRKCPSGASSYSMVLNTKKTIDYAF